MCSANIVIETVITRGQIVEVKDITTDMQIAAGISAMLTDITLENGVIVTTLIGIIVPAITAIDTDVRTTRLIALTRRSMYTAMSHLLLLVL